MDHAAKVLIMDTNNQEKKPDKKKYVSCKHVSLKILI